jgi:predicted NAD/FAD-binding protein
VDLRLDGVTHGVDTGFLVFNERTYPRLIRLFGELGVDTVASDMSFSVQVPDTGWSGAGPAWRGVRAAPQPGAPRFWRMLADIVRFNRSRRASRCAMPITTAAADRRFLDAHRFSAEFRDWYFLPMIGCIWSCPTDQMLRFPIATMIRFCHNHGPAAGDRRPRWFTVRGGAKHYVERCCGGSRMPACTRRCARCGVSRGPVARACGCAPTPAPSASTRRAGLPQRAVARLAGGCERRRARGAGRHPHQRNRAVLHTDTSLLPRRRAPGRPGTTNARGRRARAELGVPALPDRPAAAAAVFDAGGGVAEPGAHAARGHVHGEYDYEHPVFDTAAIDAQRRVPSLQGVARTWYCGAWTGYGFHEDGLCLRARRGAGAGAADGRRRHRSERGVTTPARPLIGIGQVRHARLRPVRSPLHLSDLFPAAADAHAARRARSRGEAQPLGPAQLSRPRSR